MVDEERYDAMVSERLQIDGPLGELEEPGALAGLFTVIGAVLGGGFVAYLYYYGPQDTGFALWHPAGVIGIGILYAVIAAVFVFLIGWMLEVAWSLILLIIVFGLLLLPPFYYYGFDQIFNAGFGL